VRIHWAQTTTADGFKIKYQPLTLSILFLPVSHLVPESAVARLLPPASGRSLPRPPFQRQRWRSPGRPHTPLGEPFPPPDARRDWRIRRVRADCRRTGSTSRQRRGKPVRKFTYIRCWWNLATETSWRCTASPSPSRSAILPGYASLAMLLACEPRGLLRVCTHAAARSHHMSLDMKVCLVRYIRYRWRSHLRTSYLAWGSTLIGCLNPSTCSCGPAYHLNVEFSKGAQRCPLMSRSYVRTYIGRALARNLMRKTSCIIPIQHVHTSPYHTYPYYPFTKHQDYWPSTCHMLVQQTSTGSRSSLPALLTPDVAAAPPPPICSTVLVSSKTHEPNTASGSPLYISTGSFMLRVLWSRSSCTRSMPSLTRTPRAWPRVWHLDTGSCSHVCHVRTEHVHVLVAKFVSFGFFSFMLLTSTACSQERASSVPEFDSRFRLLLSQNLSQVYLHLLRFTLLFLITIREI